MKTKNQTLIEDSEQDESTSNGKNETINLQLTEEEKEKGNFKNFSISKKMIKKLKARNVEFLFPVQAESYTTISERNDCLIQASNGTGKTLAFALPIVELLQSDKSVELEAGRAPRVLVLTSARDTTKQISNDFQTIVNDLVVVPIFTAKKKADEQETTVANGCDVLVATPDRLKEFLDNEKVDLSGVQHVVLDDADRMLDASAVEDVKKILKEVFSSAEETKAQLVVFTETSSDSIRKLTKKYLSATFSTIKLVASNTKQASDDDDEDMDETENGSLANISSKTEGGSLSLLGKQENYTTYQLTTNEEIKSVGFVFTILRKCLGDDFDAKSAVSKVGFTKDFTTAVFDLPSEHDKQIQSNWRDSARTQLGPATELPELDESSMTDNSSFSRGNSSGRGGGGFGNQNSGRSSACFKCQKEGHKSFECPEANGSQRNGGNRFGGGGGAGGGGGCFNCGKDGHKSFECSEPKKAGGGRPGGGERSNACFNCGQEGHRSYECTEPKKAGGGRPGGGERSNACFNCGQEGHRSYECTEPKKAGGGGGGGQSNACFNCGKDGHKSFECPDPKKGRPSFGGGGGGRGGGGGFGGRGGARGGGPKRSFGGGYDNGHSAGEATNKKIKFDDDD